MFERRDDEPECFAPQALFEAVTVQRVHTRDVGGKHKTSELITQVQDNIEKRMSK